MTDTIGGAPAPAAPIAVNANPEKDQAEALLRQLLIAAAAIATALGATKTAGTFSAMLLAAGPVAGLIVLVWGQIKTRALSKKAAAMANLLPDSQAVTK